MRLLSGIFKCNCIYCGGDCGISSMLCAECVSGLEKIVHRCSFCGHALKVDAEFCRYCSDFGVIDRYYSDYLYNPVMRSVIRDIKYNWRWRGTGQLAKLCNACGLNMGMYDFGVPVPYHFFRKLSRFVQPVDVITAQLKTLGLNTCGLLYRKIDTPYQAGLSRNRRFSNVKGVFGVPDSFLRQNLSGAAVLLIDDLITTGATVLECARVLKKAGADRVDVYTLISGV